MKVKGLVMAISCLLSRFKAYITCCFNCGKTYEKFDKFRRKHRYAYGSIFDKKMKILGVAKFDLALEPELNTRDLKVGGNLVGLFVHGDGRSGSEPLFVPRVVDKEIPEDDGYLICFVYDENKGKSETVIIDAKTMASEPIGVVDLPTRVPCGFHSIFVSQEQLDNQRYNSPK
jgi:carotenoid cleavage dioxygenase-like enzyme